MTEVHKKLQKSDFQSTLHNCFPVSCCIPPTTGFPFGVYRYISAISARNLAAFLQSNCRVVIEEAWPHNKLSPFGGSLVSPSPVPLQCNISGGTAALTAASNNCWENRFRLFLFFLSCLPPVPYFCFPMG